MSREGKYEVYNKDPDYVAYVPLKGQGGGYRMLYVQSTCHRGKLGFGDNAAEEMVEKLVEALNGQPPPLAHGRYRVTGEREFEDTQEVVQGKSWEPYVGQFVRYKLEPQQDDHPAYDDVHRLVGMLNRIEAQHWADVAPTRRRRRMGQLVKPKVYFVGCTEVRETGLKEYLKDTKQMDFWDTYRAARDEGLGSGEALCSVFAKLCYKSLVLGKNANVSRVRDVRNNLEGCHDTGHGSVFEHCQLNFLVTDCSRVYTHEQVRQRAGWAYSQTSGRYCRLDSIDLVWSELLDPVKELWLEGLAYIEDLVYLTECKLGLRKPNARYPFVPAEAGLMSRPNETKAVAAWEAAGVIAGTERELLKWEPDNSFDFDKRKAITSAIRRIAPNGQANEIGMSCNIRALRHVVQLRTARFAETEIRDIFSQVYALVKADFPTIFYKARTKMFNGIPEVYGMRMQPYEIEAGDPKALEYWADKDLKAELERRQLAA